MKESIHIQNFGPLRDVRIDDIKPLTVLIGDSASGKSTIMKVVALMRYIYKRANIYSYLKNAGVSDRSRSFINLIGEMQPMLTDETKINYTVHMPNGGNYTYLFDRDGRQFDDIGINKADMVFFKEAFVAETRSMIPTWSLYGARFPGADLGYYFNETFRDFSEATDRIKEQSLDYLDMKMEVKTEPTRKHFLISPNDGSREVFELEHTSSGIQASAPLMTIVRYFAREFSFTKPFQRSMLDYLLNEDLLTEFRPEVNLKDLKKYIHLYIEEPELSLDPKTQCLFINDLIREAFYRGDNKRPDDGRQLGLMFATHSPYILNHLNVLLKASYYEKARESYPYIKPDEIAVYRLHDGEVHSLMATDNLSEHTVIDTIDLSDTMEDIFNAYDSIKK
ncbi:hypothetical protein T230_10545 [Tannerella sp. oral taxon BU063 isolate Cell 1/3]|uniref:Endonuclease GajA/Old nuclease/RecF-like AAA domain-containing protein n=1 Tax=Tannerella sp. oral taxon BU063 isolate Cell 1/3 TaxID=1411022 RepID=W2CJW7_9BACT|nr:hypothetical protein T230_10545 [Tannerella sp. oral taxon BU063 isolate Cell 1/3]